MAKMEWQASESEPGNDALAGQKFHVRLTAIALGLAIIARSEAATLRQMLKDAEIEIDDKQFRTQTLVFADGVIGDLLKSQPDLAAAIPNIGDLEKAGRLNTES